MNGKPRYPTLIGLQSSVMNTEQSRLHCAILAILTFAASSAWADGSRPITSLKEIRERGIVMQKWETSCAAAAVATVLTYGFADPVSERTAAARMLEKTEPAKVRTRGGFSCSI